MSQKNTEKRAYIFSTAFVVILGVLGWKLLSPALIPEENINPDPNTPVVEQIQTAEFTADKSATVAHDFIKKLAFYDQQKLAPILLEGTEDLGQGSWMHSFKIEVSDSMNYLVDIEVITGHVVDQKVTIENDQKKLTLFEPEPEEVIASSKLVVKGRTQKPRLVEIKLISATGALVQNMTINQQLDSTIIFAEIFNLRNIQNGDYILEVSTEDALLSYPIVIASSV